MEVLGKVKLVGNKQQVTTTFVKRELVITTDGQYPEPIMIEFVQDKADLLNNVSVGENVKVSINLGGREWTNPQGETKYFNSIKGWRIEKSELSDKQAEVADNKHFAPATEIEDNGMPF